MNEAGWIIYFIALAGLLALIRMRRSGEVPKKEAKRYVQHGAVIVDVRTAEEFRTGHLSQAYNMPLDELEGLITKEVNNHDQVILVHCQNGMRAKKARARLKRIGYENVFDLGSYERAFKIVSGQSL